MRRADVLANGTFMLSQACQDCTSQSPILTTDDALFNATGLNWLVIPGQGKNDPNDEEGWNLEPNGKLLTVDTWLTPTTELFTPTSLSWSFAGNTAEVAGELPGGRDRAAGRDAGWQHVRRGRRDVQ